MPKVAMRKKAEGTRQELTVSDHDFLKPITLNEHFLVTLLPSVIVLVLDVDNSTLDALNALRQV